MSRTPTNRILFGLGAGLCVAGGLALAGLVSPIARDYLSEKPMAGDQEISRTTPPLVRIRALPHGGRMHLRIVEVCDRELARHIRSELI